MRVMILSIVFTRAEIIQLIKEFIAKELPSCYKHGTIITGITTQDNKNKVDQMSRNIEIIPPAVKCMKNSVNTKRNKARF